MKDRIPLQIVEGRLVLTAIIQIAQELPSILGMDFLSQQKLSLHIILTENLAYLQYEK